MSDYVVTRYGVDVDLSKEGHVGCPRCMSEGSDRSKDNLMVYGLDEDKEYLGAKCFSCEYKIPSEKWLRENGESDWDYTKEEVVGLDFDKNVLSKIKEEYKFIDEPYRSIRPETYKYYGVMHKVDKDGELIEQIYPTFVGTEIQGFKRRGLPKNFLTPYGETGIDVDFFGQFRFLKSNSREVVITAGEIDCCSAFQMLKDFRDRTNKVKGTDYPNVPVVSSTVGEGGTATQCRENYDWLNQFDKVIVCMDNDKAGKQAVQKIFDVVPKNKLFVMSLTLKDANEYLKQGKESQFIDAFYKAQSYMPDGVKSAADGFDEIDEELNKDRITLPPYMHEMQKMMGGGIQQGRIVNIIAYTSTGKSVHVNRMVEHMIFNSPVLPTIVTLEATAGQFSIEMLSIRLKNNLVWNMGEQGVMDFLKTPEGIAAKNELAYKPDGTPRYFVIDEREGNIKDLEAQMELLWKKHGSKLFVIDVLSDLLRGSSEQHSEDHMAFQKRMAKNGVTIINVLHTRKPPQSKDNQPVKVTEYDALGTGSFVQSAAINIVLNRDKLAEGNIEKNVTEASLPKCRGGKTGHAGDWFFDFPTATCYDLQDYLQNNPHKTGF